MIGTTTTLRKICSMKKRIRVVCGGQGSSKTYSILMVLINHCSSKPNKRCMVVSKELAKMRTNIIPDFQSIMKEFNIYRSQSWNDSKALYTFPNGSTIQFYGTDRDDAGKGTRTSVVFFNEANKIDFNAYRELASRSDNIYIDYNPNIKCWIDTEVIGGEDVDFLRVTYNDNEYLGDAEKNAILEYKEKAYNEDGSVKSEYWLNVWRVYGLGEIGSFVGTILTNITMGSFDNTLPFVYALDLGYMDEDGMVKIAVDKKNMKLYVDECLYQNHLSTNELVALVKGIVGNDIVVCDSAAARTVADLKQGKVNAVSCVKNKIVDDIKDIQGYQIVYTPRSVHFVDEINNWRWKDGQQNIPSDGALHCFTGDTKIITKDGYKNIVDVTDNDYVLTRNGYEKVWKNIDNGKKMTYICDILLSNGKKIELKCTKNHKVWTENRGWRPVSKLRKGDLLRYGCLMAEDSNYIVVKDTQTAVSTQSQSDCTDMCGNTLMEKYRKGTTYTTRTTIRSTTISRTLRLLKKVSTCHHICKKGCRTRNTLKSLGRKWTMQGYMLLNGINRKKAKTFTSDCVFNKLKNIKRWVLSVTVTDAERNLFKPSQTTTSVQEVVQIKIRKNKPERVYDLSIDGTPEFFANGILVHNCVDPMRYGFRYLTAKLPEKPTVRRTYHSSRYQK